MKNLEKVAGWLLILGGITLGLEGLLNYELLDSVLGEDMILERVVDLAIGASAVWMLYSMVVKKK